MQQVYRIFETLDPLWVIVLAVVLLGLDIFLLNSSILLVVALALLFLSGLMFANFSPEVLSWSFIGLLFIMFLLQRPLSKLITRSASPYDEEGFKVKKATIEVVSADNLSDDHFYRFKDEKQFKTNSNIGPVTSIRAITDDGVIYPVENSVSLNSGDRVKIKIYQNGRAEIINVF